MSYESGDTFSVWVDQARVDTINEFDAYYRLRDGDGYSIGDRTKQAMALQLAVDQALEDAGLDPAEMPSRETRHYVRQLILDDARDE